MIINSDKAISQMKAMGVPEPDIRDLFKYRYNIDYNQTKTGRLFMMPEKCSSDMEVLAAGYPPAYLIGFMPFFGMNIDVSHRVLIPRPETEELMEIIQNRQQKTLINTALDLCCGSGCIGLGLKKIFPGATVYASDFSAYAVQMTQQNADKNKLEVNIALSDYLAYFVSHKLKFDLIVSNPPYIKNDEILDVSLSYEPKEALFGGKDGLDAYRRIFMDLDSCLTEHGVCYLEIEASNYIETLNLVHSDLKGFEAETIKDLEGKERFLRLKRSY